MKTTTFKLPKTGEMAAILQLGPEHLPQVMALHNETRAALPAAQKMFVLPQTPGYFEKFLDCTQGVMLGVLAPDGSKDARLIAQLVLMGPMTREEMISKRAVTRNDIQFHHVGQLDMVVAVKSVTVHPDFRGNELSQQMLKAALNLPLTHAADHAFAQISVDNHRSWEIFLRSGFGIVGAAVDPGDNKPRFVMQRPVHGFTFDMAPSADDVEPAADFSAIMRLTQKEALIGRLDEEASTEGSPRLAFSASAEMTVSLPLAAGQIA